MPWIILALLFSGVTSTQFEDVSKFGELGDESGEFCSPSGLAVATKLS